MSHDLWYIEGQIAAFSKGAAVSFPIDAKEVKAQWKLIADAERPRYHWQTASDGKTYGLKALHIMTKDIPNWVWATWEHIDNPDRCKLLGCSDQFGVSNNAPSQSLIDLMKANGMGNEWLNYRLDGTQTEFVDSVGRATILGNSEIERGFVQTSSCMTCHARAGIDGSGQRLDIFTASNQSYNGSPDPSWFLQIGGNRPATLKYLQLDFLWSLFLAKSRQ